MSAPETGRRKPSAPSSRLLYLGVAGATALVVLGGASFYYATKMAHRDKIGGLVAVAVTSKACEPNAFSVKAGERTFEISNKSERPVEWEILDGVMVVAERENIAPNFKQTLKVRLAPGTYEVTCGLLSNPRGTLHVTPSLEADASPARATMRNFLGPLSEYKFYLDRQSGAAVRAAKDLADAIKAGDLAKAQALYVAARQPYKRIEPVVYRFSDLQNTIDPAADYLEKREDDPAFVGYHRIERGLFTVKSIDGLTPIADKLVVDLTKLNERLKAMKMTPEVLIDSAGSFASQLSHDRLPGSGGYAESAISDLQANLDGIEKIIILLRPVAKPINPDLVQKIDAALSVAQSEVSKQQSATGSSVNALVDQDQRKRIAQAFANLADALNELPPVIGMNGNGT